MRAPCGKVQIAFCFTNYSNVAVVEEDRDWHPGYKKPEGEEECKFPHYLLTKASPKLKTVYASALRLRILCSILFFGPGSSHISTFPLATPLQMYQEPDNLTGGRPSGGRGEEEEGGVAPGLMGQGTLL